MESSDCCSPRESLQRLQSPEPGHLELIMIIRATGSYSTYYVPSTLDLRLTLEQQGFELLRSIYKQIFHRTVNAFSLMFSILFYFV